MKNIMKRMVTFLCALSLVFSMSVGVSAHSGRTDSSGGHRDNKNVSGLGYYHYHHGYGPHLHENGKCPYESSSDEVKSSSKSKKTSAKKYSATLKKAQKKLNKLGYKCGKADGIMGNKTRKALRAYQKDNNLNVTGTLTKGTKKKLEI